MVDENKVTTDKITTSAFKVGAVVRLRSGGPLMTVADAASENEDVPSCGCVWFNDRKKVQTGTFAQTTLVAVSP